MTDIALRLDGVYKKFRKGELYDSLRDLIPALATRVLRGGDPKASPHGNSGLSRT